MEACDVPEVPCSTVIKIAHCLRLIGFDGTKIDSASLVSRISEGIMGG